MSEVIVHTNEEAQRWNAGPRKTEGDQSLSARNSIAILRHEGSLAGLPLFEREIAITATIESASAELKRAVDAGENANIIASYRDQAAAISDLTKRLGLSKDATIDAQILQRFAERYLAEAVRVGQENGDIRRQFMNDGPTQDYVRNGKTVRIDRVHTANSVSPMEYFTSKVDMHQAYAVTDDVTAEQFGEVITAAKAEGNMSRRNVVAKVRELKPTGQLQTEKWTQIEDYSRRGFTSTQIAKTFAMSEEWLRKQSRDRGITFPADKITGGRRIDGLKVLNNVVASTEANASALELVTFEDVTPEMAAELLERLEPGIKAIRQLAKTLKEIN